MKLFDPSCTRCELSADATNPCIPSSGPDDADIMFFGEAPGANEDKDNEVFIGQAGRELDGLLSKAKLKRSSVRVSNAVRCRPPGNATPRVGHVQACSYYTIRELQRVRPKVIVALGGSALKALTGQSAVGANRGKLLPLLPAFRSDVRVIGAYHPASYAHQPQNRVPFRAAIVEDMRLAKKVARGAKLDALVVTGFDGDEAMDSALDQLEAADRIACDLEWERLPTIRELKKGKKGDPIAWPWSSRRGQDPRAVSISIAGRVDGQLVSVAVPLMRTGFADLAHRHRLRRILRLVPSFYHSATGDLIWLYSRGWHVQLAGCTLVLAGLLGIEGSRSLASLAGRMTKMPADWKLSDEAGSVPRTDEEWREKLIYNGRDTVATVLVLEAEERRMKRKKREAILPLYERVLLPAISILARASLAGVPIDEQRLAELYTEDEETVEKLTRKVGRLLKIQGDVASVVANSAKLGPYIERATGATLPETQRGTSVTKDILAQLRDEHPAIRVEMKRRKAQSRINNNWRPWSLLLEQQGDSRLHTIFKQDVARSGRTTAESEAGHTFQQFLKGAGYRGIVRARKNWRIGSIDQSQIEMRAIAWLAGERRMTDYFERDDDLHVAMAALVKALSAGWTFARYMREPDEWLAGVTADERQGGKVPNFGCGFGGGPKVLQRSARQDYNTDLTDEQSKIMHEAYHLFYPDVAPWHDSCWEYVERGWVETPTHRIRDLVLTENEDEEGLHRKAINTGPQNFATDLSQLCMVYTEEQLLKEYGRHLPDVWEVIGFFHDAEQFHYDRHEGAAIKEIVQNAWEHPPLEEYLGIEFPIPLKAEVSSGRRWTG